VPKLDEGKVVDAPAGIRTVSYSAASDGLPELLGALGETRTLGVEEDHLVFARANALAAAGKELAPAGSLVMGLRARKDAAEVEQVARACSLVAEGLTVMLSELRPGDVERDVNAKLENWFRERGATDVHSLILFGANAANPHGEPGTRVLAPGDVVCADASARLEGYWGDLTRCATVGPSSDWAKRAWAVVRQAQEAAIEASTTGAHASDVDAAQRQIVEAAPELGNCLHGAGHGIGLAVHEPPFLVPRVHEPLDEGMILTIEPGLYQPGVGGIRLEDDVLVTGDGPRILCELPLELTEIPAEPSKKL
jgi:Xaa-Pro dipeptidase